MLELRLLISKRLWELNENDINKEWKKRRKTEILEVVVKEEDEVEEETIDKTIDIMITMNDEGIKFNN